MCLFYLTHSRAAAMAAQRLKRLPPMRVRSLGGEDPLEKERATHSSIHAWKIPRTEEPGELRSMVSQRVRHDWMTSLHYTTHEQKHLFYQLLGVLATGGFASRYNCITVEHFHPLSPTSFNSPWGIGPINSECKSPSQIGFPENLT